MNKRQREQLAQQQAKWQYTPDEKRTLTGRLVDTQTLPKRPMIRGHSIDYIIIDDVDYARIEARVAQHMHDAPEWKDDKFTALCRQYTK